MDIEKGFQIEDPEVFVPWSISQAQLLDLLSAHGLRKVTTGYFTITCKTMNGKKRDVHEIMRFSCLKRGYSNQNILRANRRCSRKG